MSAVTALHMLALAVPVAALGVATWLLLRSMRHQLKKIDFEEDGSARPSSADGDDRRSVATGGDVEGDPPAATEQHPPPRDD